MIMKEKTPVVKRNIIDNSGRLPDEFNDSIKENDQNPECTGAPITYCNRWECYTHFLCLEEKQKSKIQKEAELEKT